MTERYFSSNPEHGVVGRFGTGSSSRANTLIGAYRDPNDPRRVVFTDEIVAIPELEYRRFRREYDRALRSKALRVRTADEYRAFLNRQAEPTTGELVAETSEPAEASAGKNRKGSKK